MTNNDNQGILLVKMIWTNAFVFFVFLTWSWTPSSCKVMIHFSARMERYKRQAIKCFDTVTIQDCESEIGKEKTMYLSRIKTNQIVANFRSNCPYDDISYNWMIKDEYKVVLTSNNSHNVLLLKPFALEIGGYGMQVEARVVRDGTKQDAYWKSQHLRLLQ
jgi:hypothetical protein